MCAVFGPFRSGPGIALSSYWNAGTMPETQLIELHQHHHNALMAVLVIAAVATVLFAILYGLLNLLGKR